MEITQFLQDIIPNVEFKIDLIVWKSDTETDKTYYVDQFKIDLIVWKLRHLEIV